jgi:hypothetical protein
VVGGAGLDCDSTEAFTVNFLTSADPECLGVGVEENEIAQISVYPNPSNGTFTVEIENMENHADMIVLDVAGREVYSQRVAGNGATKQTLRLDLNAGSYLLKVVSGGKTQVTRIVIQ